MELLRTLKGWQLLVAGIAFGASVGLAIGSLWPFNEEPRSLEAKPAIWDVLIHDQWVLGFLRLALVMGALYVIMSVPALAVAGRWIEGIGAAGITADDAKRLEDVIADQRRLIAELESVNQNLLLQADLAQQGVRGLLFVEEDE